MTRRPKLLFLTFYFPPYRTVASVRAACIAKYLVRAGWDVSVVTPDPALWRSTEDPERVAAELDQWGVQRIYTGHRWRCLSLGSMKRSYDRSVRWFLEGIPRWLAQKLGVDERIGWYSEAIRACARLQPGDVDVILATSEPCGTFRVARAIAKCIGRPFCMDYRDPWSGNAHSAVSRRALNEEKSLLADCAAVTIVSPSLARSLRQRFPSVKEVHVVTNGYDPEELRGVRPRQFDHFAIYYAGGFYHPYRVITPVMKALQRLRSACNGRLRQWRFHYAGPGERHVLLEADRYGVRDRVIVHGCLPRKEALSGLAGADVNVVITSVKDVGGLHEQGIVTGKLFESLGLGSRVLLIAPTGSDAEAVVEGTHCGRRFTGDQTEEMVSYLLEVMAGQHPKPVPPREYSWPEIARSLDNLLRRIVGEQRVGSRDATP